MSSIASKLPWRLKRSIRSAVDRFLDVYSNKSYSQEGEDMILRRIFRGQTQGFYVDVGAHHPRRYSNTYCFYRLGWNGINIEPNPDFAAGFRAIRPRDIILQIGVDERAGLLKYYSFNEPALNTFDPELMKSRLTHPHVNLVETREVEVRTLASIFEAHLPPGMAIDFLTVDVEGLDFAVLRSNDWQRFRPKCVLVEVLGKSLDQVYGSEISVYMRDRGYDLFAKTFNTVVFRVRAD
jgi:FkbM family methyltransferase